MPLASLCLAILASPIQSPTVLARKFVAKEKLAYALTSHITAENRQRGLSTWLPSDLDINYGFTYVVQAMKPDGIAVVRYDRPTMTQIDESDGDAPKKHVEKVKYMLELTISPINEIIDVKDLTPPKKPVKKPATSASAIRAVDGGLPVQGLPFAEYIGEMHRMALFIGNLNASLDFSPKLPLEPVKVGDSWKRTVGYQPQKLQGKEGKSAVQRLDYVFTYLGPMTVNGKPILRIQAKLDFTTDLADYLATLLEGSGAKTNIKKMPLQMKATIDYDLDPKTRHTISAAATSEGGYGLFVTGETDAAVEERFKGRTNLELVGRKLNVKG